MEASEIKKAAAPKGLGFKLFKLFSKVDTQKYALTILILLALQVLYGVFEQAADFTSFIAYSYGKAVVIRLIGYLGLVNAAIDFYCRVYVFLKQELIYTFIKRPWTGLLAILLLWAAFAILIAQDKVLAIFGGPYRYEGYLSMLAYMGIFANSAIIKKERYLKILFAVIMVSATVLGALTLVGELAGASFIMNRGNQVFAYSGTFGNPNHYGYFLCVSMTVTAGLYMMSEKLWAKLVCGACFALNTVVLLYNMSLGPFFALAAGLLLMFILYWIRRGIKAAWPLLILIALLAGLSLVINEHKMLDDVKTFKDQAEAAIAAMVSNDADSLDDPALDSFGSSRGKLWRKTVDVILEHPVMGVGTDNEQLYIGNEITHNEYLQVAANVGIPGGLMYLAALILFLAYSLKNVKKFGDGTLVAFTAVFVYCFSAFVGVRLTVTAYQLFLFLGLVTGWFRARDDEKLLKT